MLNRIVSHYKLTEELGRGGMAEVYEAIDLNTQRHVALKLLLPHLSSDTVVCKRFLREAKVGLELDHPGIAKVYEVGQVQERPFIAMELVKGKTLEDVLRSESLDIEKSIDIGLKVADALAAAHKKKIIHRDIKPRNIMLSKDTVKVMDFGLARILETSSLTDKHEILGTLYYMSPQQAIGDKIDERSDIFSLGVVLYQMFTEHLPFVGEHPGAIIHSILYSDPLRMKELGKAIPVEMEQVAFKALQKKPQQRYQTAVELRTDLERVKEILKGKTLTLIATEEVFEESPRGIYSALVGREQEMKILEGYLEQMLKGESTTVLVSGEAGIGKSRLIWELGRKAKAKQARYMLGRCLFGEKGFPYQPILEILRSYVELKGIKESKMLSAFIEERAPHLRGRMEIINSILLMKAQKDVSLINKEQLWDTFSELIKVMSQDRAIILHVDDLHWADQPTLNLLIYLSRSLREEHVVIIGTYRPEELAETPEGKQHPLQTTIEIMHKEGLSREIRLTRLDRKETHSVIRSVFSDTQFPEKFSDSVYKETEGNPLFILEVLKLLKDEGVIEKYDTGWKVSSEIGKIAVPGRVSDVIMNRLRKLSRYEKDMVDVAAVEGYTFQSDTICHSLGLSRLRVLRGLQNLESSHHLIHALEREYQFDHGKIQETIYDNLIPELRREYHKLIADCFEENYGDKEDSASKIAHHLIEAGKEKDSLPYLIKAGMYAQKLFANEEALEYFNTGVQLVEKYLDQQPTTELERMKLTMLKGRAGVNLLIGYRDEAQNDYEDIVKLAQRLGDLKEQVIGLHGLGNVNIRLDKYGVAENFFDQGLKIHRTIGDRSGEASALHRIGIIHFMRGNIDEALRYSEEALEIRRQIGDKQGEGRILNSLGDANWWIGNLSVARNDFEQALKIFRDIGERTGEFESIRGLAAYHWVIGDFEISVSLYEQNLEFQRQTGNKLGESRMLGAIGKTLRVLGDYAKALDCLEQSLRIERQFRSLDIYNFDCHALGELHCERGDYDIALSYLERALKAQKKIGDKGYECYTLNHIGFVNYHRGNYETALSHYIQARKIQLVMGNRPALSYLTHFLYEFWMKVGNHEKAREMLEQFAQLTKAMDTRRMRTWKNIDGAHMNLVCGAYREARLKIQEGLTLATAAHEAWATVAALLIATRIEIAAKNVHKATVYAEEALKFATEKGRKRDIAEAHLLLSRIYLSENDLQKAESHANKSIEIAENIGTKEILWQAHHCLAKVFLKKKKHSMAQKEMQKAKKMLDTILANLSEELRKPYLKKKEIKEFYKDLKSIKRKPKKDKKS